MNHVRTHTKLGDMPPAEYKAQHYANHPAIAPRFVTPPGNETPEGGEHAQV
jgi:hypothetical protein